MYVHVCGFTLKIEQEYSYRYRHGTTSTGLHTTPPVYTGMVLYHGTGTVRVVYKGVMVDVHARGIYPIPVPVPVWY